MPPHTIAQQWRSKFGNTLPAGFLCRRVISDRWLRVHSLPLSKRYAETDAERLELLRRQNAVATFALGEGTDCLLFITRFGEDTGWSSLEEVPLGGEKPEHVFSAQEDGDELQFFALPVIWRENSLNELIVAVADGRTGPVLFTNIQRRQIYAPYDGGADLFFASPDAAISAHGRFGEWLSSREDGL